MKDRFELKDRGILWTVRPGEEAHSDEIEMSGRGTDFFVRYGVDETGLTVLSRYMVFPFLRTIPNNTHASFQCPLPDEKLPMVYIDGKKEKECAVSFFFDGVLTIESRAGGMRICRIFFPADEEKAAFERIIVANPSNEEKKVSLIVPCRDPICRGRGTKGCYRVEVEAKEESVDLKNGEEAVFDLCYTGRIAHEKRPALDAGTELAKRYARVRVLSEECALESGDPFLDRFFAFAKLRAGESIFRTEKGLLHSPGGRSYYAATWCNDEIEYAGPFFATTGDDLCFEASMNAYRQYIPFMDDCYHRIPSSVISEGNDIWEGAGDRGDAAMYLYGASLFCLYSGNREAARELWDAIKWCAEYCRRKTLPEGVISSDTDELEGRFGTDKKANLSTSCLCCGGLRKAAVLAREMGEEALADDYEKRADALALAIENYFGADLHGFHTYRYSKGFDSLRGWICLPLVVGLEERKEGTVRAMLSPYLWTENGMLSCEQGEENPTNTVWDRAALYGFKGAILCGMGNEIFETFENYMRQRLLGSRVPYPVEAFPEGNMRHLSGESALFCRVITEGFLGIEPMGLNRFALCPRLPKELSHLHIKGIRLCGMTLEIYADHRKTQVFERGYLLAESPAGMRLLV